MTVDRLASRAHPEAIALLLADARLPVGGHARSAGLEPALAAGVDDVPGYIALRLRTVTRTDAATAVVARAVCLGLAPAGTGLDDVRTAWAARTPSAAIREDARLVGRALTRLADRLWEIREWIDLPPDPPGPLVLGAVAAATGLDAAALARSVGYDDIQTVTSAALKLTPLDPLVAVRWTTRAFDELERLVIDVAGLVDPQHIPARNAPSIEAFAEAHTAAGKRLFRA